VDGVTHSYIWESGRPLREILSGETEVYSAGDTLYFFYDQSGSPYALLYNGTTYYYILNGQGDVVRLVDSSGAVMASYEYDPYGKILSATGSMAEVNPLRYRGYYYDAETGFYYVNSRYYDPGVGRFLNADTVSYLGANGDLTSFNLFSYCGNNPVNRIDFAGQYWTTVWEYLKTVVAEISNAMTAYAPAYAVCGGLVVADGPIPVGDLVGAAVATVITACAVAEGVSGTNKKIIGYIPDIEIKEKEKVVSAQPPQNGTTYFHVTTLESAMAIMTTGIMSGSSWEGGYVYAWRTRPSKYAIKNSGAHFGVTISFKTNASFTADTGISNPRVQMYGPVVSVLPGPIAVWDVWIER